MVQEVSLLQRVVGLRPRSELIVLLMLGLVLSIGFFVVNVNYIPFLVGWNLLILTIACLDLPSAFKKHEIDFSRSVPDVVYVVMSLKLNTLFAVPSKSNWLFLTSIRVRLIVSLTDTIRSGFELMKEFWIGPKKFVQSNVDIASGPKPISSFEVLFECGSKGFSSTKRVLR